MLEFDMIHNATCSTLLVTVLKNSASSNSSTEEEKVSAAESGRTGVGRVERRERGGRILDIVDLAAHENGSDCGDGGVDSRPQGMMR